MGHVTVCEYEFFARLDQLVDDAIGGKSQGGVQPSIGVSAPGASKAVRLRMKDIHQLGILVFYMATGTLPDDPVPRTEAAVSELLRGLDWSCTSAGDFIFTCMLCTRDSSVKKLASHSFLCDQLPVTPSLPEVRLLPPPVNPTTGSSDMAMDSGEIVFCCLLFKIFRFDRS
ncbi:unnamed protein product [Echinostoma caproni]|uniref:Protein kinase domain-containing protein n=1 Tax=Echinostoma caproni TaxID=27848 RepID=A0A183BAQ4_9TREM|nr:unnamed protein product [Echinostoma caproni]